jgi:hypothetical protein
MVHCGMIVVGGLLDGGVCGMVVLDVAAVGGPVHRFFGQRLVGMVGVVGGVGIGGGLRSLGRGDFVVVGVMVVVVHRILLSGRHTGTG